MNTIPTNYSGVRFRSRLEARWAQHLDHAGLDWQYEPESYTLPNGDRYLPDFWIPSEQLWLEVKGPTTPGREKIWELSKATGHYALIGEAPLNGITNCSLLDPPNDTVPRWIDKFDRLVALIGDYHSINRKPFAQVAIPSGH